MTTEIETLNAKMLKLPTMSMKLFDNILKNIDEHYPFSLSHKFILALLLLTVLLPWELFSYGIREKLLSHPPQ